MYSCVFEPDLEIAICFFSNKAQWVQTTIIYGMVIAKKDSGS